jgi:ribosomal protein S18 acetylase RimI-like enzyme
LSADPVPAASLRPAEPSDRPFLLEVYTSTRADELAQVPWADDAKRAFLEQQFTAQDTDYRRNWPDASYQVIVVDGKPAGRLYVDRADREIHILDIALLPAFRNRGVGSRLLRSLADEGDASGRLLSIYVERLNPARALYGRLGFGEGEQGPVYIRMERPPGTVS